MIEPKSSPPPAPGAAAEPPDDEGLPTRVRAAEEASEAPLAPSAWGDSALPVPPPAEADGSQDLPGDDDDDTPTLGPARGAGPRLETEDDPRIPAGQDTFKIGEVAKIVGVKPYVLRYWESEIASVQPDKTDTRQRRYRRADVATLLTVRRLRHEEKLSLARIRVLLQRGETEISASAAPKGLDEADRAGLRRELDELRRQVRDLLEAVED